MIARTDVSLTCPRCATQYPPHKFSAEYGLCLPCTRVLTPTTPMLPELQISANSPTLYVDPRSNAGSFTAIAIRAEREAAVRDAPKFVKRDRSERKRQKDARRTQRKRG